MGPPPRSTDDIASLTATNTALLRLAGELMGALGQGRETLDKFQYAVFGGEFDEHPNIYLAERGRLDERRNTVLDALNRMGRARAAIPPDLMSKIEEARGA